MATWPDAAVSDDYITGHGNSSTFDDISIQYAQVENDATSGDYHQIQIDLSAANGISWSNNSSIETNLLFVFSGNINDESLAGGKSASWPTVIRNSSPDNTTENYVLSSGTLVLIPPDPGPTAQGLVEKELFPPIRFMWMEHHMGMECASFLSHSLSLVRKYLLSCVETMPYN